MIALLIILAFVLMVAGIVGVILPFFPGMPVTWLGFLILAWTYHFEKISPATVLIFLGLTVFAYLMDFVIPMIAGKKYRASKLGMMGAGVGMIIGTLTFNPINFILFTLAGAFLGEVFGGKEVRGAYKSTFGFLVGFVLEVFLRLGIVLTMLGFAIVSLLR